MDFPQLTSNILVTHNALQNNAMRAINQNITARNWLVGYWIVEFEQNGENRAKYGEKLLSELAKAIKVRGLGIVMLNLCRKFYKTYPTLSTEIGKFLIFRGDSQIIQSLIEKFQITENENDIIFQSLIGKLPIPTASIFQTVTEKSDDRGRQCPDRHIALHRCLVRNGKVRHGGNGRELVCLQVFAPTARKREIC